MEERTVVEGARKSERREEKKGGERNGWKKEKLETERKKEDKALL